MLKFVVNLIMLFNEVLFFDCFKVVVDVGFDVVEFLFLYLYVKEEFVEWFEINCLCFVFYNLFVGNWDQGECGIVCLFDCVGEFQEGVGCVIEYVKVLKVLQLNCFVGILLVSMVCDKMFVMIVDNLCFVVDVFKCEGICLFVELCNSFDILGFVLNCLLEGFDVICVVGLDNLFLQYDIYYM